MYFISYNFCEIADVNLPDNVKTAITEKETQKQVANSDINMDYLDIPAFLRRQAD